MGTLKDQLPQLVGNKWFQHYWELDFRNPIYVYVGFNNGQWNFNTVFKQDKSFKFYTRDSINEDPMDIFMRCHPVDETEVSKLDAGLALLLLET